MTTRTAGRRRAQAQYEDNANLRGCPGHEVLAPPRTDAQR
jgi:hypothetical protein